MAGSLDIITMILIRQEKLESFEIQNIFWPSLSHYIIPQSWFQR